MIVESNFVIAITRHTDWLKDVLLVFSTNEKKKTNCALNRWFSLRFLSKLQIIARNSHNFIALFAPVGVHDLKENLAFTFK